MRINSNMIKKGMRCIRQYGIKELVIRATENLKPEKIPYEQWYRKHKITPEEAAGQRKDSEEWEERPLVSICVPLYQTPEKYLREMIDSVKNQTYTNWQLCLADGSPDDSVEYVVHREYEEDTRICYKRLEENLGIAENTNAAFALAKGEWIALLDHDDILAPDALYEMLAAGGDADVVYSDEDKVTEDLRRHFKPHFKPDYNPALLCSNNYITHFFMAKREIVEQVGGFRREYDGSQDYDFIFRCVKEAEQVVHVPRILYHWRVSENSTADNPESKMYAYDAGKRAIEEHLRTEGISADVYHTKSLGFYRVKYHLTEKPLVTIFIENMKYIRSVEMSGYENYEIVLVEDGKWNEAAIQAKGEYLVWIKRGVEMLTKDWLEEMLGHCQQKDIAAVGCKLLTPDKRIFHAGIVIGEETVINYAFAGMRSEYYGYMHRAMSQMNYSAVSGKCMMVKKSAFTECGGFDANLTGERAAVDLCLRMGQAGYRVVYTPYTSACVHEKKVRVNNMPKEELSYMRQRWAEVLEKGDTCYNPNLMLENADYSLKPFD